jgi:hypothetical protein
MSPSGSINRLGLGGLRAVRWHWTLDVKGPSLIYVSGRYRSHGDSERHAYMKPSVDLASASARRVSPSRHAGHCFLLVVATTSSGGAQTTLRQSVQAFRETRH